MTRKVTIGFYGLIAGTGEYSDKWGEIVVLTDDPDETLSFIRGLMPGLVQPRVDKDEPA